MNRTPNGTAARTGATITHSVYDVGVQATTEIEDTAIEQTRLRPLVATTTLFIAIVVAAFAASARQTGGHLVYALDDPYIHMAMARNVALHGVWGVTASHFTSSSSSLLWTAGVAALFRVFGVHQSIPLLLNVGFGILLLRLIVRYLAESTLQFSDAYVFTAATGIALIAPLPALVFAGQEHILHGLVNLAFVALGTSWLAQPQRPMPANATRTLCAIATLLPLIRFESLFVIGLVAALLAVQGRWKAAVLIGTCGVLPVALYGALSHWYGWYWLPNSVLLKGARPDFSSMAGLVGALGGVSYSRLMQLPALTFLVSAALAAFIVRFVRGFRDDLQWMLGIFVALTLLHTQFAQPGAFWFFRYEAYLFVLGGVAVARALGEWLETVRRQTPVMKMMVVQLGTILLVALSPLSDRALKAIVYIPQATKNIYEQQYQMGLFLGRFYEGRAVALNDIGAASFLGDIDCVDLAGLADIDVARHLLAGLFESEDVRDIAEAKDARIAIVYDSWFGNRIPASWRRAATWTVQNNVVLGGNTVTFYALRPEELGPLRAHLNEFSRELPPSVVQHF
jgi:hypothetical protein